MRRGPGCWIALAVLAAILYLALRSDDRPDLLAAVAGCYSAPGQPGIAINRDGILRFDKLEVRVMPINAKYGVILRPERGLYIDSFHQNRLMLDTSVLLLQMSPDYRTLAIPDFRQAAGISFSRIQC